MTNIDSRNTGPEEPLQPVITIVVPCYNEEDVLERTIGRLLEECSLRGVAAEVLAVDNGSTDGTSALIDEMMARGLPMSKLAVPVNHGYGYGTRCGLAACRTRHVGVLPADGQVDPRDIVQLAEVLINSRTPKLCKVRRRFRMDGWWRKLVSSLYNLMTNVIYGGLGSIDINGSPKMFPREYLDKWNLESDDWFLDAEMLIKARHSGLEVFEQNVFAQMREGGSSNVGATTIWEFLVNLGYWRLFRKARVPGRPLTGEVLRLPSGHRPEGTIA